MPRSTTQAESVFVAAVQIKDELERISFLNRECGSTGPLREEVDRLVALHQSDEEFLAETRKAKVDAGSLDSVQTTQSSVAPETAGAQIGPYTLLQQIGEGGMGVVFMAEQKKPVRRRVALKLIKSGMDTKEVLARFEAERQSMAMMDHPNIAKVLDAGQSDKGRPYFVMELVMGTPITTFCNERKLSPRQRLELFIPVCRAIQHAHQKGVIHRDLKPSNVLVAHYDEQVVPKVIDFGLAKAMHQALTEQTLFTRFGQLVGTWEYMSPEQAKLNQLDVDTRSDVYSLGVLLYELLTGQTPFDRRSLKEAALDEVLRVIREVEPPRPSQRLRQTGTLAVTAASCGASPERLENFLRGDLDAVIGKTLEKDRNRRYDTAAALAEDVKRYLADEPVIASAPTALDRARKFIKRNRIRVNVAAVLTISILATVAAVSASWARADSEAKARIVAEEQSRRRQYSIDMASAYQAWQDGKVEVARSLLDKYVPQGTEHDLRGFEWRHIKRLCDESKPAQGTDALASAEDNSFVRQSFAFLPGDQPLIAAVLDENIPSMLLWDAKKGFHQPPRRQPLPYASQIVAYSPDGRFVAFVETDHEERLIPKYALNIRELVSKERVLSHDMEEDFRSQGFLVGEENKWGATDQCAFSPNRRRFALRSNQYAVMLYEWSPHKASRILWSSPPDEGERQSPFRFSALGLEFSPDGATLAIAMSSNTVALVDAEAGSYLRVLRLSAPSSALTYSPDGRILITATKFGEVAMWDVETGEEIGYWNERGSISDLRFSPDGRRLAISVGRIVRIRDLRTRRVLQEFRGHDSATVHYSPHGDELLAGDVHGLKRWRVDQQDSRNDENDAFFDRSPAHTVLRGHQAEIHMLSFHPNGRWLASAGGSDRSFRIWDLEQRTEEEMAFPFEEQGNAWSAAFANGGNTLVTGGMYDWGIRYWEWPSKRLLTPDRISCAMAVLSPNGRWYSGTGSQGHFIREMESHEEFGRLTNRDEAGAYYFGGRGAFSPIASQFAAASNNGYVELLDVESNEIIWSKRFLRKNLQAHMTAFSPNGELIAVGWRGEPTIQLISARDGESAGLLAGHSGASGYAVAFSPDGRTLASTGADGALRLWDVATREQRFVFHDEGLNFNSVTFSSDGRTLAVGHGPEIWLLHSEAIDRE